jgi:hypothetical protein
MEKQEKEAVIEATEAKEPHCDLQHAGSLERVSGWMISQSPSMFSLHCALSVLLASDFWLLYSPFSILLLRGVIPLSIAPWQSGKEGAIKSGAKERRKW